MQVPEAEEIEEFFETCARLCPTLPLPLTLTRRLGVGRLLAVHRVRGRVRAVAP